MDSANATQQVVEEALTHFSNSGYNYESFSHLLENEQVANWVGAQFVNFLTTGNGQSLMSDLQNILGFVDTAVNRHAELNERNAELASALGACTCWGEAEHCEICHGEGTPGWMMPNREMFSQFVLPALLTINQSNISRIEQARRR